MNILRQVGILAALCWLCHIVEDGLPFGFPASVIGMLALFILLAAGILKRAQIGEISDFLLSNMAFFFIPVGVSIMNYFDLLKSSAWKLVVICFVTMVLTFGVTAWTVRAVMGIMARGKGGKDLG